MRSLLTVILTGYLYSIEADLIGRAIGLIIWFGGKFSIRAIRRKLEF